MTRKLPSRNTVTAEGLLNNIQHTTSSIKGSLQNIVSFISANAISATQFGKITGDIAVLHKTLAEAAANPDIDKMAQARFGYDVTPIINDVLPKLDAALQALHDLVPTTPDGFLKVVKWDTDGTFAWRSITPAQMAGVARMLTDIADGIE